MIKGGRMSGKSIDLGKSKGKFDTVFISMSIEDWNKKQKHLKALEIIKEKRVDITTLFDCRNAKEYNRWVDVRSHYSYRPFEITQEEYDLLKEILL